MVCSKIVCLFDSFNQMMTFFYSDAIMSYAMITEKAEIDIMSRPPSIRKNDHLLNLRAAFHAYLCAANVQTFGAFFCFCYYWIDNGVPFYSFMFTYENFGVIPQTSYNMDQLNEMVNISQSIYYSSLCIFQFFNFFATRTRYKSILQHNPIWGKSRNLYVFGTIIISTGIQLIFTEIPWFNQVFGTTPIPAKYVMPTLGFGMLWLIIDELRKLYIRKYPCSLAAKIAW
jgi:sodium/potassium-transporting ATPase subunit alpha